MQSNSSLSEQMCLAQCPVSAVINQGASRETLKLSHTYVFC